MEIDNSKKNICYLRKTFFVRFYIAIFINIINYELWPTFSMQLMITGLSWTVLNTVVLKPSIGSKIIKGRIIMYTLNNILKVIYWYTTRLVSALDGHKQEYRLADLQNYLRITSSALFPVLSPTLSLVNLNLNFYCNILIENCVIYKYYSISIVLKYLC